VSAWEDALRERIGELRSIADDPDATPVQRQQALIDGLAIADGMGKLLKAKATAESHAASLRAVTEMGATVKAYRRWAGRTGNAGKRPTQEQIATERNIGERTLAMRLRKIGITDWHDVHAIAENWPEG
jgi:hypothetical protein